MGGVGNQSMTEIRTVVGNQVANKEQSTQSRIETRTWR